MFNKASHYQCLDGIVHEVIIQAEDGINSVTANGITALASGAISATSWIFSVYRHAAKTDTQVCDSAVMRRQTVNRSGTNRNEDAWHDKNVSFRNTLNPVTERVVLFKHPFHLCRIPALGHDGGVERSGKVRKCRIKRTKQNVHCLPSETPAAVRLRGDVTVWQHCCGNDAAFTCSGKTLFTPGPEARRQQQQQQQQQ